MNPVIHIIPNFEMMPVSLPWEDGMAEWQDYKIKNAGAEHTVVGSVNVLAGVYSPQLNNKRDLLVYLPPSYDAEDGRYPVLYIHDGQNVFDAATSYAGEWRLDETLENLAEEGIEAIAVAIPNMEKDRLDEYSPFHHPGLGGGKGKAYLDFIIQTVKPIIDRDFRTCPEREHTGIFGSSMGGLISLYAFFKYPAVFGFAGAMSPSLWFGRGAIFDYVEAADLAPGRLYLDGGTREHGGDGKLWIAALLKSRRYYASLRRMQRLLVRKGYWPRRHLLYIEEKWGRHEEAAWARRLPAALRFLLGPPPTDESFRPVTRIGLGQGLASTDTS